MLLLLTCYEGSAVDQMGDYGGKSLYLVEELLPVSTWSLLSSCGLGRLRGKYCP